MNPGSFRSNPYLRFGIEYFVEGFEGVNIELDEFAQQIEAALQYLLGSDVVFNNVASNML